VVAPYTTDGDLALDPDLLAEIPPLAEALVGPAFVSGGRDAVGVWLTRRDTPSMPDVQVQVDLLVPEAVSPGKGRRAYVSAVMVNHPAATSRLWLNGASATSAWVRWRSSSRATTVALGLSRASESQLVHRKRSLPPQVRRALLAAPALAGLAAAELWNRQPAGARWTNTERVACGGCRRPTARGMVASSAPVFRARSRIATARSLPEAPDFVREPSRDIRSRARAVRRVYPRTCFLFLPSAWHAAC